MRKKDGEGKWWLPRQAVESLRGFGAVRKMWVETISTNDKRWLEAEGKVLQAV